MGLGSWVINLLTNIKHKKHKTNLSLEIYIFFFCILLYFITRRDRYIFNMYSIYNIYGNYQIRLIANHIFLEILGDQYIEREKNTKNCQIKYGNFIKYCFILAISNYLTKSC